MPDEANSNHVLGDYLTEEQLADQLGRTVRTLRRWHAFRQGPARTTVGKKILYRRNAVSDWLRANEHAAA